MWSSPICNVDVSESVWSVTWWVHDLQLEGVDFVLDSKKVIDYFHKGQNDATKFGDVLKEFKCGFNLN
jgi:hypothetical protein